MYPKIFCLSSWKKVSFTFNTRCIFCLPSFAPELSTALHDLDGGRGRDEEVLGVGGAQLVITVQRAHDPVVVGHALEIKAID